MKQDEITFQSLTNNEEVMVGYSDNDIVIIDSVQKLAEISAAHVSMNAILVCIQGKVQATMNGQTIELNKNQMAIIPQNVFYTDLMVSPDLDLKAMFFTNRILQSFLREKMNIWNDVVYVRKMHVVEMDDNDYQFYINFYDILCQCFDKDVNHPFRIDIIQSLLRGGILKLCGMLKMKMQTNKSSSDSEMITANSHFQQFLDLLHSVEVKHHPVGWYANQLCISPKYLSVLCKTHSGKTANEWIRDNVLEDIRYYLKQTDLPMTQIADCLGFPNPSFFCKYVKQHFGLSPVQFREDRM